VLFSTLFVFRKPTVILVSVCLTAVRSFALVRVKLQDEATRETNSLVRCGRN